MEIYQKISDLLKNVRQAKPLVHHITNYVTVNDCANIVLAIGGSPVMADEISEVEEMVSISSALVLNLGTINHSKLRSMLVAGKKANQLGIPVILDPVGVGATQFRLNAVQTLLREIHFAIIKGNMSEIMSVAGLNVKTRGVDSTMQTNEDSQIAKKLAHKLYCTVAITGAKDVISDGQRSIICDNGHSILSYITGTGCMTASLMGVYAGVSNDYLLAATAGVCSMGVAGEMAFETLVKKNQLGTFKVKLFDKISSLSPEDIIERGRLYEV